MKHHKNRPNENQGHVVEIRKKGHIVSRNVYLTYGKAMWAIDAAEKIYDEEQYTIKYFDARVFRVDDFE
jgi:hypothetical protein